MALKFASLGHRVIGCARSPAGVAQMSQQLSSPHRFDVVDISDNQQVASWGQSVMSDGSPPDLLLNNAGLINQNNVLWETPSKACGRKRLQIDFGLTRSSSPRSLNNNAVAALCDNPACP